MKTRLGFSLSVECFFLEELYGSASLFCRLREELLCFDRFGSANLRGHRRIRFFEGRDRWMKRIWSRLCNDIFLVPFLAGFVGFKSWRLGEFYNW